MHALLLGCVTEASEGSDWVMKHLSNLLHGEKAATQEGKDVEKKQDQKRTSEKVIRLSNQYEAAKSARQLQLV